MATKADRNKIEYFYQSAGEYLAALADRPIVSEGILGKKTSSNRIENRKGEWAGVTCYEDALKYAVEGDENVAREIKPREVALVSHGNLTTNVYDVSGDRVDIDRYLLGEPECMVTRKNKGKPIVNILVNITSASDIRPEIIQARGKAILEIMSGLEINGYGVEITVALVLQGDDSKLKYRVLVRIKDAKEYFNLQSLSYWLVCPSVLRRLAFRHMEQESAVVQKKLGSWYAYPIEVPQDELDEMPDCVYFPRILDNNAGQFKTAIEQVMKQYKD